MIKVKGEIEINNIPLSCIKQEKIETPIKDYCVIKIKDDKSNFRISFKTLKKIKWPANKRIDRCCMYLEPDDISETGEIIYKLAKNKPIKFLLSEKEQKKFERDIQKLEDEAIKWFK